MSGLIQYRFHSPSCSRLLKSFLPLNCTLPCVVTFLLVLKFAHKWALVGILLNSSLRDPCMILHRSLTEDLVEILAGSFLRGPCIRSLPCLRGACMKGLGKALGGFFYQDLVTSAPTAAGPSLRILRASLHGPGVKILVKVF